jgi:HlyD family secretion protein
MNTVITGVLTAENSYQAANSSYDLATQQLKLESSGAVSQEVDAQRAQVAQAQANVNAVYAQLAKSYIKAPIAGIVTKQDTKLGETAPAGINVVSVMSDAQFEIEAFVPEADIARVKVGQNADITLDAYGQSELFKANIVAIDPAETMIEGVATYKTTFQFQNKDDRIRSGMTANIDIMGETHENALSIPQRAIVTKSGTRYVTVKVDDTTTKEVQIKTGIRGNDGSIEIVDGLKAGDQVVIKK